MTTPNDIAGRLDTLAAELRRSRRANKWSRIRDALLALLTVVDVWLTVSVIQSYHHSNALEDCRNRHNSSFFHAEVAKVSGQVAGLQEIRKNPTDEVKVNDGFNRFIAASQHYLDVIKTIPAGC